MRRTSHERGTALIIVLGLVAVIGAWAVEAAYGDMLSLRRAENHLDAVLASQGSRSALALAVSVLVQDSKDSVNDHLDEVWAIPPVPFPVDNGSVTASIIDANRFFNLNSLVDRQGRVVPAAEKRARDIFIALELDSSLVDTLIDWIDPDDSPHGSGGAESSAYYAQDYRVKNSWLDSWSELALLRGFDAGVLASLSKLAVVVPMPVTAQPASGQAAVVGQPATARPASAQPVIGQPAININTVSAELLALLIPGMPAVDAETVVAGRPYDNLQQATLGYPWAAAAMQAGLSVVSDTFMVRTESAFGRAVLREQYMVRREAGKITLLACERMPWAPRSTEVTQ